MRSRVPILILTATLAGCGEGAAPLPLAEAARQALEASLDAWKAGKPPSSLADRKPAVEVVDFEWKARKVLTDYEIGEVSSGQGSQTFDASITLKGDPGPKSVKYMALGLDPVRIFRDEDYERAMNMDNAPAPTKKPRK